MSLSDNPREFFQCICYLSVNFLTKKNGTCASGIHFSVHLSTSFWFVFHLILISGWISPKTPLNICLSFFPYEDGTLLCPSMSQITPPALLLRCVEEVTPVANGSLHLLGKWKRFHFRLLKILIPQSCFVS